MQLVAAALLFSTGGAAIKIAAFSPAQVASLRSGIAAAALLVWLRGRVAWSTPAFAVAASYAATLTLFVVATRLTTAANAIFLQSAAPLYIAALAPFLIGEPFRRRDVPFLVMVAVGLAFCLGGGAPMTMSAPDPDTGNLFGALCGISWALTLIGFRLIEGREGGTAISAVVIGNGIAFAVGLPALRVLPSASVADWATLGYLGVFQIGFAYILLTKAVGHLSTLRTSLILLLEPVLNPVWTWLVRGEDPGMWTMIGGGIIMAATAAQAAAATKTD